MDDIDRELLRLLSLDARLPAAELARDLKISRATVQNRIDKLQANGTIKRFTIELGQSAESALIEAIALVNHAPVDNQRTLALLKRLPEVESLSSAAGTYDLILELRASSLQRLDQVLMEIRRLPNVTGTNSSIRLTRFK